MNRVDTDPFERVRAERDPLRQAKAATELITLYQQRLVDLARLRKEAINRAATEHDISFSAIATELGLTRGRITQIRQSAPPAERAFFGVGPVTVAVPLRAMEGRPLPVISSEDSRAADTITQLLTELAFHVERYRIPTDGRWTPRGDVVAICGPKSSPISAQAIAADPHLTFEPDATGRWTIRDRATGTVYESPMDETPSTWGDVAYVGRLPVDGGGTMLIIAGVHALGSVGAVDYLAHRLSDLHAQVGDKPFSMVVRSEHDGETITTSELACPPRTHD